MYTEKTLEANAKLKQEIARLKADMKSADNTAPDTLEQILAAHEAELKSVRDQESAILQEYIDLCKELDRCNFKRAELTAALQELTAIFNQELEQARKAKSNFSRNYEHLNH